MSKPVFRIVFVNAGEIYEIYAAQIMQSNMFGFIEIEQLIFGEKSQLLVDPSEEKLKNEFDGVKRTYIPTHSIIRIDEVVKAKVGKIREGGDKVAHLAPYLVSPTSAPKP